MTCARHVSAHPDARRGVPDRLMPPCTAEVAARQLKSGPRTRPRYQEALDRVIPEGGMFSFDTDMTFAAFAAQSRKIPTLDRPCPSSVALHAAGPVDEWPVAALNGDASGRFQDLRGRFPETRDIIPRERPLQLHTLLWEM